MLVRPPRRTFRLSQPEAEIPTSSMADIAFLLIIYFMVTTVFSATQGMDVALPDPTPPDTAVTPEPSIYIRVLPGGGLQVDGSRMALDQLLGYVVPRLRRNQAKPVILHTDPRSSYQEMVRVYDELLSSGERTGVPVRNITIPTEREIQEYIELLGHNPFEDG